MVSKELNEGEIGSAPIVQLTSARIVRMDPLQIFEIDRTEWGRWHLDEDDLVFRGVPEHPGLDYVVKVEYLATQSGVWGWIRQVQEKTWCTEEDLGHFVRAAFALMRHQSVLGKVPVQPPVMTPWHNDWVEFLHHLGEEISLTYDEDRQPFAEGCGHDPDCPKAVEVMRTLGLDEGAIERSLAYFREHGGRCDCRILLNVESSLKKQG